jgi:SAM-dependent methyltransferase
MHAEAYDYVTKAAAQVPHAGEAVLEIGSIDINGSVRGLFTGAARYVGIDRIAGAGVDVVTDARDYDGDGQFAVVVCCEVLEHEVEPQVIIACAWRTLRAGGALILTCASTNRKPHSADGSEHPRDGEHYRNIDPDELRTLLKDWEINDLDYRFPPGDVYATALKPAKKRRK